MATLAVPLANARHLIDIRWPQRDRASDGWIGDAAHQGRTSDHNPNGRGVVDALDVDMFGGATPVHRPSIVAAFLTHPAINYVIFNRRIFQNSDGMRPRTYSGINPHDKHCHGSIFQSPAQERSTYDWPILRQFPYWHTLARGQSNTVTAEAVQLQAYLNAWGAALVIDGDFGNATHAAVQRFQAARGLHVDGIVGPKTYAALMA